MPNLTFFQPSRIGRTRGFSLIEMMVAITLGLVLSAGIVTLFSNTTKSNRVQDSMARLQENGRYAISRINADMRMLSAQYCSNFAGASASTANGPIVSARAPEVYVQQLSLPDAAVPATATAPYQLSPRAFVQGYECSSGTCSPAVPTTIPAVGTADQSRLKGTDVLTIRYQRGSGWPMTTPSTCAAGTTLVLDPQIGDDSTTSPPAFAAGDYALVSDCQSPTIVPISGFAGNVVTIDTSTYVGGGLGPACTAAANRDTRVFNFKTGFITVTYFIKLVKDLSPDAAGRLIPVLVRRVNGTDAELVQGVERLDFIYGVQDSAGAVRYLTADAIDALGTTVCPAAPDGFTVLETGCMWRTIKSVEVHTLMDSINNMYDLTGPDMAFRYSPDSAAPPAPPATATSAVTGLPFGKMIRREFMTTATARNYNP